MAETVFILGAGASNHAGAPVMRGFLDRAFDLLEAGELGAAERIAFELVREGRDQLQRAHSKARLDLDNLEEVFGAFEMAALVGRLGDWGADHVDGLPEAMRTLITVTLERLIRLPLAGREKRPSPGYEEFARMVSAMHDRRNSWPAVITFNYDVCADYALHYQGVPVNYHLTTASDGNGLGLCKLHGSLNWAYCAGCQTVTPRTMADHLRRKIQFPDGGETTWRLFVATETSQQAKCPKCGSAPGQLMMVPPTWAKGRYQPLLKSVWAAAARELSAAQNIIVCGYSLPNTDAFFHYLYAVGSIGTASLRPFRRH
jgi:NAD-dependent SIR2 family protein deacetylase